MLLYSNASFTRIILCRWGSIFWQYDQIVRSLFIAVATGVLQHLIFIDSPFAPKIPDKYALHAIGVFVGFACVFRTNLSWARYWEAVTHLHFMYSKWGDAFSQIHAFATVTMARALAKGTEEGDKQAMRLTETLDQILRNFTLMSAIAANRLIHGDVSRVERRAQLFRCHKFILKRSNLTGEDITDAGKLPVFSENLSSGAGRHKSTTTEVPEANNWSSDKYIVKEMPLCIEMDILKSSSDRPSLVMYWIIHDLADISLDLDIASPIQSRIYQELSNGMLALKQAEKVADVPFPFPYAQLMSVLITCYSCFIPVFVAVFTQSYVGPVIAFILFQGTWGINQTAAELENPFGSNINNITLVDFHDRFLDLCTEVRVGHRVKTKAVVLEREVTKSETLKNTNNTDGPLPVKLGV